MTARPVTDQSFTTDVLQAERPVLVDFWAPWCGPCRQVGPILDELATEHAGRIDVVKLNVDENPEVTARYGITSIPALSVYSGGEVVKSIIGARPKSVLVSELSEYLTA